MKHKIFIPIALLSMVIMGGCGKINIDAAGDGDKRGTVPYFDKKVNDGLTENSNISTHNYTPETEDTHDNNSVTAKEEIIDEVSTTENTNDDPDTTTKNTGNDDYIAVSQKGWYIRISTQTDKHHDSNTVFGYLQGASDRKDRYDSKALMSSGLFASIYHTDFGNTKNYRSDYRAYKETGERSEKWVLRVNSGDANADVTMSWDGITFVDKMPKGGFFETHEVSSAELDNMRLIDAESGEVIDVSTTSSYQFNMGGKRSREFNWLMLADDEDEPIIKL